MNAAVIHYNDRVLCRIVIHVLEETLDKPDEIFRIKGPFNDVAIEHSFTKTEAREDGVPAKNMKHLLRDHTIGGLTSFHEQNAL